MQMTWAPESSSNCLTRLALLHMDLAFAFMMIGSGDGATAAAARVGGATAAVVERVRDAIAPARVGDLAAVA